MLCIQKVRGADRTTKICAHTTDKRACVKKYAHFFSSATRITFAEDELSDDPDDRQDGQTVTGQSAEKSNVAGDGGVLICSRVLSGKRLFEEDELSDDECSSVHNGAAVLRRTRALRK